MDCLLIFRLFLVNFELFIGHDARIAPSSNLKIYSKTALKIFWKKFLDNLLDMTLFSINQ